MTLICFDDHYRMFLLRQGSLSELMSVMGYEIWFTALTFVWESGSGDIAYSELVMRPALSFVD